MTSMRVLNLPADRLEGEVVAALFFLDERPLQGPAALLDWRLDDVLTRLLVAGRCVGRAGEHLLVRNNGKLGSGWALFVGGGSWHGLGPGSYRSLIAHLLDACRGAGFRRVSLCLTPLTGMAPAELEILVRELLATVVGNPLECLLSLETV